MSNLNVKVNFDNEFKGELIAPNGRVDIGNIENSIMPYDMLLGALASCLYATFLSITKKKRINFDEVNIEVYGEKREGVPTTLKWVNVKMIVKNTDNEKGVLKSMELAAKYCSIYETISKVAEMNYDVNFVND